MADLTSRARERSRRGSKQEEEEEREGFSCMGRECVFNSKERRAFLQDQTGVREGIVHVCQFCQ